MKKKKIFLIAGAALVLAACSNDEIVGPSGGGGSVNAGGTTTVVSDVPSVPVDNYVKAAVRVTSSATTPVSVYYETADEGRTPLVTNYLVAKGDNMIEFSAPSHVRSVVVAYTAGGAEAQQVVALNAANYEYGQLSVYVDSKGEEQKDVWYYKYENGGLWHEHWRVYTEPQLEYLDHICNQADCVAGENEKIVECNPQPVIPGDEEEEIVYGECDLGMDVTDYTGNLETAPGVNQGTTYHTAGVVMFDSYWPTSDIFDADFMYPHDMNDVVIDYDLESVVIDYKPGVNDEFFAQNDWKEGLTVTMHVRAVGSYYPQKVGLKLEGLSMDYVKTHYEEIYLAAEDGEQFPVPNGSLSVNVTEDGGCPVIWINNLQYLNSEAWRTSEYVNDDIKGMNVRYNTERKSKLYWLATGEDFVNRTGPLFTVKVKFEGEPRAALVGWGSEETLAQAEAQVNAYKNAAANPGAQNFFITTGNDDGNTYEIHVGGFAPLESYKADYSSIANGNALLQNAENAYYVSSNNGVWGVKAPMLVKHIYQGESFVDTYQDLESFLKSWGEQNKNWYNTSEAKCDDTNLVKYW